VCDRLTTTTRQVDKLLGERYRLALLLPGCALVAAGVLLCTTA
jgi:hypothetical protein